MSIYHTHHIIPKHMGGTDDPENLVKVTVKKHAQLHKQLWEDLGNWQDKVAWLALEGLISSGEATQIAILMGSKKASKIAGAIHKERFETDSEYRQYFLNVWQKTGKKAWREKYKNNEEFRNRHIKMLERNNEKLSEKWKDPNYRIQRLSKFAKNKHQQGERNSQYGTCWITDGINNKKIKKNEIDNWLSMGYYKGRITK